MGATPLYRLWQSLAWPFLVVSSGAILAYGFSIEREVLFFNLSYTWIVVWLLFLEWKMPYRKDWRLSDGQLGVDLGHTILNKGLVQFFIVQLLGLNLINSSGNTFAQQFPLFAQVVAGLILSEIGLYAAHRIAHEWPLLWRFHAVHHSVKKLWLVNTGRFHFVDSFASVFASMPFLIFSGISMDAIVWVSAITAYVGILTHCNVDMRCGFLNYIFNTPNLHRWHHSTRKEEGNTNYGENLMLWDQLCGTFLYNKHQDIDYIGINDHMPARLIAQLKMPFVWRKFQQDPGPDNELYC